MGEAVGEDRAIFLLLPRTGPTEIELSLSPGKIESIVLTLSFEG